MSRLVAIISLLANLREETCPQMCSLVENVTPIPCCSVCMIPCCSVSMICTSPVCLKKACCSALQCVAVRYTVCCSASQCVAVCKTWLPTQTGHVNWSCHTFSSVNESCSMNHVQWVMFNESCYPCQWVVSHKCMRHVAHETCSCSVWGMSL